MRRFWWIICLIWCGCNKSTSVSDATFLPETPAGFPEMEYAADNTYSDARWRMGQRLFFDTRLSIANDVSCATCHPAEGFFSDDKPNTPGTLGRPGSRNVPSLVNIGYHPYFTREGAVPTLEQQILVPIQEHNEFGHNIVAIVDELRQDPTYASLSQAAYGQEFSAYTLTRALGVYERTLISGNSPYDRFVNGEMQALTAVEKRGLELFFSDELGCGGCHTGTFLTSFELLNNGLYQVYPDPGLFRLTNDPQDSGKFKVASLRNISRTAPYMHDGSLATLEEVLNHYAAGGQGHANQDARIQPFTLTPEDEYALLRFLESLTDETFFSPHP